ncbi:MAG TPA: hypothetical protein VHM48_07100 [Candidatus Limnocylindrales bacterium]|nr:hypothetical protein [Candidatus Limnocylindrales bacterium]
MHVVRSFAAAATVILAVTLTACGGGGTPAPANPSAGGGGAAASGTGSQASQATGGSPSANPSQASNGGGGFSGDPCSLVSAADVSGIFGGSPVGFKVNEYGACTFEINGTLKAGSGGAVGGQCQVKIEDDHTSFDTAKMLFGDAVKKVDGLGADAWSFGGFVHVQIGAQDLIVGGVFVGNYDRDLLASETTALTKLILTRI